MKYNKNDATRKKLKKVMPVIIGGIVADVLLSFYIIHVGIIGLLYPTLEFAERLSEGAWDMLKHPFNLTPFPGSVVPILLLMPLCIFLIVYLTLQGMRRYAHFDNDTVQGEAKWDDNLEDFNKHRNEPYGVARNDGKHNLIISQNVRLGYDNEKTRRNLNMFIVGGSGAGKSYGVVRPNIMQMAGSMVITDPSGELYSLHGHFLEHHGYKVKCFNIDRMELSNHYNPIYYVETQDDIIKLVTAFIKNTDDPTKKGGDAFWNDCISMLMSALIGYLVETQPREKRTFQAIVKLLLLADGSGKSDSELDQIFLKLEAKNPKSWAVTQYKMFKQAADKTMQSIHISASARLQRFTIDSVIELTGSDDIELDKLGDEKTALFLCIPAGEKSFNFLAALMYTQLFQLNYRYSENEARYSQLLVDSEDEVWKTFRATKENVDEVKEEAGKYLSEAKGARIEKNRFDLWEIKTDKHLIGYRGSLEDAQKALELLKGGRIKANSEQTHDGQRLPIHLSFIMDEFANTGQIPGFPEYVATMRKYDISVIIIVQSVTQMQNMYREEWEGIAGNCDTVLLLGGGADTATGAWVSTLLGKETRIVQSASYSDAGRKGSVSYQKVGVELLSPSAYSSMKDEQCVAIIRGMNGIRDSKYNTSEHEQFETVIKLKREKGPFVFSKEKGAYFKDPNKDPYAEAEHKHGEIKKNTSNDENDEARRKAKEAEDNEGEDGKPRVADPAPVDPETGKNGDGTALPKKSELENAINNLSKEAGNISIIGTTFS